MDRTSKRSFKKWPGVTISDVPFDHSPPTSTPPEVAALLERKRYPFQTEECQQERRYSLTATNFSSIVGVNKYKSLKKLLNEKINGIPGNDRKNAALLHGIFFEPEALRVYTLVTGNQLVEEEIGFVRCDLPGYEFVGATPDAVCKYKPILVEIKCPYWKKSAENRVPDIYWPQLMIQCLVTKIHTAHFVQYFPPSLLKPSSITITEVHFDPDWWAKVAPLAKQTFDLLSTGAVQPPKKKYRRTAKKKPSVARKHRAHTEAFAMA